MTKSLRKVIWSEGMFLGQQHFQQWDRCLEDHALLRSRSLHPFGWGLISAGIDDEALDNGRYRLTHCQAILPDGRLVAYEAVEDKPLVCELDGDRVEVYLCMPANRDAAGLTGYPTGGRLCAWEADYREVPDEFDASREREVTLGRPNLMLLTGDDSREQVVSLKLAELVAEGEGRYRPVEGFIPAHLRIGAAPTLVDRLTRLEEIISAKTRVLNERRAGYSGGATEFGHSDLAHFLLLQTLNGALPSIQHCLDNPDIHPEQVYRILAQTAGALCSFATDGDATTVAPYRHSELADVFAALDAQLRELVDVVMPARMQGVRLERVSDSLYAADSVDSRLLRSASFYLAAYVDAEDPAWVAQFARQVKVGSREGIEMIVASAMPGVRLVHTQRPPNKLPVKSGYEYFRLEPRGEFWEQVVADQSLGIFLPQAFVNAKIDVLTVEE